MVKNNLQYRVIILKINNDFSILKESMDSFLALTNSVESVDKMIMSAEMLNLYG